MPPGVKFLQVLTDDPNLNRVQANVAEALRRIVDNTNASVAVAATGLAPVGAVPNANAATLVAGVLTLEPADATHPGLVSTTAQSLGAGDKYFSSKVGIGTTAPAYSLDVSVNQAGDTSIGIQNTTAGALARTFLTMVGNGGRYAAWINFPVGWTATALADAAVMTTTHTGGFIFYASNIVGASTGFRWMVDGDIPVMSLTYAGGLGLLSTNGSGSPGNITIDKPTGRAAIAIGASSCVVTNAVVAAADTVLVSRLGRDVTATDLWVSAVGAGSFTVTSNAVATAAAVFMFTVIKAI